MNAAHFNDARHKEANTHLASNSAQPKLGACKSRAQGNVKVRYRLDLGLGRFAAQTVSVTIATN
jgi:hypothetical protein